MKQSEYIQANGFIVEVIRTSRVKSADIKVEDCAVSVVAHELCHLQQHDHSPKFWKLVEQVIPDYTECKGWLKVNGRMLML
ncbi:MAG: M48 family metallopeptidase [Gammaproteobacteria bacterium]|nr:M48 family metallopeptidase [Gammaproteobacteria bacterium]